jgi:hypothetical protein
MIRANVKEDMEATMTRFINGLNYDMTFRALGRNHIA